MRTGETKNNYGAMKSYQLLNSPLKPVEQPLVAQVAEKLLDMGFKIITGQFGDNPSITVQPTAACRQLESVCTGQGREGGLVYVNYAAGVDGVKVVWHKPKKLFATH